MARECSPCSSASRSAVRPGSHPALTQGELPMRFIVTARRDETKPTVGHVDEKLFAAYMKFNEEIHKAGVLMAAEGMLPGAPGARVGVVGGKRRVIDGPFAESKELVGGFYLIDVA